MQFQYIVNPATNRRCRVDTALGKRIIRNYKNTLNQQVGGGAYLGCLDEIRLSKGGKSWGECVPSTETGIRRADNDHYIDAYLYKKAGFVGWDLRYIILNLTANTIHWGKGKNDGCNKLGNAKFF